MPKIQSRFEIETDRILVSDLNVRKTNIEQDLDQLAKSIETHGLLQPVVVYWDNRVGKYKLLVGQRRFLACRDKLKWNRIPARIIQLKDDTQAAILSFSENIQRLDLEYRDKMTAAVRLVSHLGKVGKVAEALGVTEQTVRNYLGYAGVPEPLKELVDRGRIRAITALNISRAVPDATRAVQIAEKVREEPTAERKKLLLEVARANPSKPVEEVTRIAHATKAKLLRLYLTAGVWQALDKAAEQRRQTPADLAETVVEEWLRSEKYLL